jgi:hypothetical protein
MISDVEGILLFCAVLPRLLVRDLARFSELRCRAPRDPDEAQRPPPPAESAPARRPSDLAARCCRSSSPRPAATRAADDVIPTTVILCAERFQPARLLIDQRT